MSTPPLYTASATVAVQSGKHTIFRSASASSSVSEEDARAIARKLAQTRAQDAADGRESSDTRNGYPYPERTLVEPIIERITHQASGGDPVELARITRNSYDASILNAYSVMFVDVDTMGDSSNAPEESTVPQDQAIDALVKLTAREPSLTFRVYATKAGLRYLCTSRLFDPCSEESARILATLRADKRYATLCRVQKCYRARLSPKPWRSWWTPPAPEAEKPKGFFARLFGSSFKSREVFAPERFATCNYIQTVGNAAGQISPQVEQILHLHDRMTEAASRKPLA